MSRDRERFTSFLLTLLLKANYLIRLVKGLIGLSRNLNFFQLKDWGEFEYFSELMIIIDL